jgi:hypothetical protein
MRNISAAVAAGTLLIGATPPAQTGQPANAITVKPTADPSQKKVCREVGEIGSRLRATRICRTPDEWREAQLEARRVTERIENAKITFCAPPKRC